MPEGGIELDGIMPPINPFDPSADRQGKIQRVVERLKAFFNRFAGISDGNFTAQNTDKGNIVVNLNIHNHFDGTIDNLNINGN